MNEIQNLQSQITKKNKKQLDKQIKSLHKTLSTLVIKIAVKNMRLLLECGYLHDDLHENNVLVTTDNMEPYLIDFGKMYTEEHLIERFPDIFTIETSSQTRVTFLETFLHIINTNDEVIIYDFVEFFLSALMNFLGFEWAMDYLTPYDETDMDDDDEESDELSMEKAMAIFDLLRQTFIPYDESQNRLSMHQMYVNGGAKQNKGLNKNRGKTKNKGIKQKSKKGKSKKHRKTKRKQSKY
jgi:predicted unusual protein kinase regulating ubiquinone biosynthesis (AarF/ABC1/UbiB family)